MSDATPTRSAVLELKDERHAMREGYNFLDEKCMLLAGEMLRELAHHDSLQRAFLKSHAARPSRRCGRRSGATDCRDWRSIQAPT